MQGLRTRYSPLSESKAKSTVDAPIRREEMRWKAVERKNGVKKKNVLVKELPKKFVSLGDVMEVDVVESTLPEESVRNNISNNIAIVANPFQVLEADEASSHPSPLLGMANPSPPVRPSPMSPQDRFPEIIGCWTTTHEASLKMSCGDSHTSVPSPSSVISYGERVDPMVLKDDFMEGFGGVRDAGGYMEDSVASIAGVASGKAVEVHFDDPIKEDSAIGRLVIHPITQVVLLLPLLRVVLHRRGVGSLERLQSEVYPYLRYEFCYMEC